MTQARGTMEGRICMVTGANSGIGAVTARELARMGARVVVVCRDSAKAEAAAATIREAAGSDAVEPMAADFASLRAVRALADEFRGRHAALHVLVNNAGLMLTERRAAEDGLEEVFCVNHLAPFLLTNLLLDTIRASAPARIVNVSSEAHRAGTIDFDDLQSAKGRYRGFRAYAATKLANILFTAELARRLDGSGVTANSLHPGTIASGFGRRTGGAFRFLLAIGRPFLIGPERGARTSIHLASSPEVEGVTGKYWARRRVRTPSRAARDGEAARRLWEISAGLVGLPDRT